MGRNIKVVLKGSGNGHDTVGAIPKRDWQLAYSASILRLPPTASVEEKIKAITKELKKLGFDDATIKTACTSYFHSPKKVMPFKSAKPADDVGDDEEE